ncbi:MAG: hypothetical protein ABSG43_23195 [Solirubrobacteraceae bacterium]
MEAVHAQFATGGLLLDAGAYKLDAGRREAPGEVEYHAHTVDVMHVVQGAATVVTGGEMVGVRDAGDGELRAASITGGHDHELSAGDVLAVPAGVPHQFTRVSDPFLYFVVKVEVCEDAYPHSYRRGRAAFPGRRSCCPDAPTRSLTCRPRPASRSSMAAGATPTLVWSRSSS